MLRGNTYLLKALPEMLGCTQADFCRKAGIDVKKFCRWTFANGEGFNPQIFELVNFCNRIQLSPSVLIQSDIDYMRVPEAKEVFPPGREWREIRFEHTVFIGHFGKRGPIGLPAKQMIAKLGKSDVTFREGWKKPGEACTIRLNDLFMFCEEFNIDINKFLIDPNGKIYSEATNGSQDENIKKMRQYQKRIRELNNKLKGMEEELVQERKARISAENKVNRLTEELAANNWNFPITRAAEETT